MDLGMAMVGGNAFFREQQAEELRNRERARFDWETRRANAEMGLLDAKTAADRSGYVLRQGQNEQGAELLPGDTANKKTKQQLETGELTGQVGRQPQVEETKNITASIALEDAKNDQLTQPDKNAVERNRAGVDLKNSEFERDSQNDVLTQKKNVQTIATALSNLEVEELPRALAQKRLQNEISQSDSDIMVGAKLSDLIDAGDTNSIVRLLNAQKKTITDPKIAGMPDVASVSKAKDANGVEYLVLKDAQGRQITARPIDSYRSAKASLAKIEYKSVDAGDSLVRVQGGKVSQVFTAPESQKSTTAKMGPMERDVNYLVNNHGMTQEQALAHLKTASTMSRAQFILKSVQDSIAIGKTPTQEQEAEFGRLYDRINGGGKSSNTPSKSTMSKKEVRSVIGLD